MSFPPGSIALRECVYPREYYLRIPQRVCEKWRTLEKRGVGKEIERREKLFFLNSNFPTATNLAERMGFFLRLSWGCWGGGSRWEKKLSSRVRRPDPKHDRKSRTRYAGGGKKNWSLATFFPFHINFLLHALPHIKHTHKTKPTKMFTTMSMKTVAPVRVRSFLRLSRARRRENFLFVPFFCK